jgi:hypothetical protein
VIAVPQVMVDAAVAAWHNKMTDPSIVGSGVVRELLDDEMRIILTAAFATCTITEEWEVEERISEDEVWEKQTMVSTHRGKEDGWAFLAMMRIRQQEDPEGHPGTFHLMRRYILTLHTEEQPE